MTNKNSDVRSWLSALLPTAAGVHFCQTLPPHCGRPLWMAPKIVAQSQFLNEVASVALLSHENLDG